MKELATFLSRLKFVLIKLGKDKKVLNCVNEKHPEYFRNVSNSFNSTHFTIFHRT